MRASCPLAPSQPPAAAPAHCNALAAVPSPHCTLGRQPMWRWASNEAALVALSLAAAAAVVSAPQLHVRRAAETRGHRRGAAVW